MKIIKAKSQSDFFTCMQIRTQVFIDELKIKAIYEVDEEDKTCDHYLLFHNSIAVGTIRVVKNKNSWHLGRIAILKDYRKNHFGSLLLKEIEELAKKENITKLELGAHKDALQFYLKNGYKKCGDSFIDAEVLHYPLEKIL